MRRQTESPACRVAALSQPSGSTLRKGPFVERDDLCPIGFLTRVERERLDRFPEDIPDDDLFVYFRLSQADHDAVDKQREAHTRLGFALQLCALRYLGFARMISAPRLGRRWSMWPSN